MAVGTAVGKTNCMSLALATSVTLPTSERSATAITADRRQKERFKVRSNAVVTVLGIDVQFDGWLVNYSEGGAQLKLDRSVPIAALVKIECLDFFLLGEVVYCHGAPDHWVVGVNVEHGLYGLEALGDAFRESWLD